MITVPLFLTKISAASAFDTQELHVYGFEISHDTSKMLRLLTFSPVHPRKVCSKIFYRFHTKPDIISILLYQKSRSLQEILQLYHGNQF